MIIYYKQVVMSYEQVKSVHKAHVDALMSQLGVVGCGIGKLRPISPNSVRGNGSEPALAQKSNDDTEFVIMIFTLTEDVQVPSTLSYNGITVPTEVTVSGQIVAW